MSILLGLIIFGIIVVIHEFGHFIFAKLNKIGVVEFSVGMGPRLCSFVKGETRYSLKLLPFGGSCAMLGEDEDNDGPGTFSACNVWGRIAVVAAGPIFNFILAFALSLILIGCVGIDRPTVLSVEEGSNAAAAGLKEGDLIVSYNGMRVHLGREIYLEENIAPLTGDAITIVYERDGKREKTSFLPNEKNGYLLGISYYKDREAVLSSVVAGSAAEKAGLRAGDKILSINDNTITSGASLEQFFAENPPDESVMNILYERDGRQGEAEVHPIYYEQYTMGFTYNLYREKTDFLHTLQAGLYEMKYQVTSVYKSLAMLVTGKVSANDVSGPVGIVSYIGETYEETKDEGAGIVLLNLMNLTILLSANLGVMNLLPIPALDGGRLVFLVIEAIRKKPVPRDKEAMVHFIGFALLMALMVLIVFNDVWKLIH